MHTNGLVNVWHQPKKELPMQQAGSSQLLLGTTRGYIDLVVSNKSEFITLNSYKHGPN